MSIRDQIIKKIKTNRISTTEIADCLGKTGVLPGAHAVNRGHFAVGKVKWVYAYGESNWSVHEQVRDTEPGDVVFIEAFSFSTSSFFLKIFHAFIRLLFHEIVS